MKKFIALSVSLLIFVSVFSGCKFNISDLIKTTPITTAAESITAAQNGPATTAEAGQTSAMSSQATANTTQAITANTTQAITANTTQATTANTIQTTTKPVQTTAKPGIQPNGAYTTKEDVSLYIHTYKKLPGNFITKEQARALKWPGGDLEPYAPGKCIGGDYFGNYPDDNDIKPFPEASGRKFFECDIDTLGADDRGPKRLVYSNDGLIYYTPDHYESFIQLY